MSIIGTGVAAGVAASQQQAQAVSRKQHKDQNGAAEEAKRVKDIVDSHILALDEGDESDSNSTQVRIDNHVPEHKKQPGDAIEAIDRHEAKRGDEDTPPGLSHIDLKG